MKNIYRIEELNPFQEWHLHGSTVDQQEAINWAQDLCTQIKRSVRVLDQTDNIVKQFDAEKLTK